MLFHLFIFIFLVASCAKEPSQPFTGRILVKSGNTFKLENVEFSTLTSLHPLKGDLASFYGGSALTESSVIDGNPVNLDFTVQNNVIVPRNFESLELLTVYHHLEVNVAFWETLGLDWSAFTRKPMPIMVDPSLESDDQSIQLKIKGNEAYLANNHGFLIFKASKFEQIPIAMNPMVFAHEFGHAVFYAQMNLTYENATECSDVVKAMTEGLSDYFAYMIVGETDIIGASLNVDLSRRKIPVSYKSREAMLTLKSNPYELGSVLASSLYEATLGASGIESSKLGQNIFKALADFGADWKASSSTVDMSTLLGRILGQSTASEKTVLCTSFLKWFDDSTTQEKLVTLCGS